jgi:hypothetical protein
MATMRVVLPGDSTVKHVEVDVPERDRIVTDLWTAILTRGPGQSNDEKIPYGAAGTNGARQRPIAR